MNMTVTGSALRQTKTKSCSTTNKTDQKKVTVQIKAATSKRATEKILPVSSTPSKKTIKEEAMERLSKSEQTVQHVTVRFSHYKKKFNLSNGVLQWIDIDQEYCISFVYRGAYKRLLYVNSGSERLYVTRRDDDDNYFLDLDPEVEYYLDIVEDPIAGIGAEGLRLNKGPVQALSDNGHIVSGNRAVKDITKELKSMDVSELHSIEAKILKEARDIEDVLFSARQN